MSFPVIALGASVGGLEAFKKFFQVMPTDSGMAFVLIQHMEPTQNSIMVDLIAKYTRMEVLLATQNTRLAPDTVYLSPPNQYLSVQGGVLRLSPPTLKCGLRAPIDHFFCSMAEEWKERAICVVLSGMGNDGALGLGVVKAEGGLTIVQDPANAQHDGMPNNAIATGVVDRVLPAEEMPNFIQKYTHHFWKGLEREAIAGELRKESVFKAILSLIHIQIGCVCDFQDTASLTRCIFRRMALRETDTLEAYMKLLKEDAKELQSLYRDLQFGVSGFFQDPSAWEHLEDLVLSKLLQGRDPNLPVRFWVPGCYTGEDAYTLAILALEAFAKAGFTGDLHIIASDMNDTALEVARAGVYPESITCKISSERLQHFFIQEGSRYRVGNQLRESVLFTKHNLLSDPPFSELDLVCCRNLLLYLEPEVQKSVIQLFHRNLLEDGYLFLGPSETLEEEKKLFQPISQSKRIYRHKPSHQVSGMVPPDQSRVGFECCEGHHSPLIDWAKELLQSEPFPGLIINFKMDAIYCFGPISLYLKLPDGQSTFNVLEQAREGVGTSLQNAVRLSMQQNSPSFVEGRARNNGKTYPFRLHVRPLHAPVPAKGLFLITFEDLNEVALDALSSVEQSLEAGSIRLLQQELTATREELQSAVEALESSNQELNTVNSQLQGKVSDLESAYNDLTNLLNSTDIATLFLDNDLNLRWFTPLTTNLFRLMPLESNKSLKDIQMKFEDGFLVRNAEEVIRTITPYECEVHSDDGLYFLCRILPYCTKDNQIDGVVITFIDITKRHQAELEVLEQRRWLNLARQAAGFATYDWDLSKQQAICSQDYFALFGLQPLEAPVTYAQWLSWVHPEDQEQVDQEIQKAFAMKGEYSIVYRVIWPDDSIHWLHTRGLSVRDHTGKVTRVIGTLLDVTEQKELELSLRVSEEHYRLVTDAVPALISYIDKDYRYRLVNSNYTKKFGKPKEEILGRKVSDLLGQKGFNILKPYIECGLSGQPITFEKKIPMPSSEIMYVRANYVPHIGENGEVLGFFAMVQDITEAKKAQIALEELNRTLENRVAERTRELRALASRHADSQEKERMRIAEGLHDSVCQLLAVVQLKLDMAGGLAEATSQQNKLLREANDILNQASDEIRGLTFELSSTALLETGLISAAEELCAHLEEHRGVKFRIECQKSGLDCSEELRPSVYHCVRELLLNVAKHAEVNNATLRFETSEEEGLRIIVHDKGKGFDPKLLHRPLNRKGGFGLLLLRERIHTIGGKFSADSFPGQGTKVIMEIPGNKS